MATERATGNVKHRVKGDSDYYSVLYQLEVRLTASVVGRSARVRRGACDVRREDRGQYISEHQHRRAIHGTWSGLLPA